MKILFLTQIIPYPPDAGPKVKTWHVLRYLVQCGHQVTLISFCREEEKAYLVEIQQLCEEVIPIYIKRSRIADIGYWIKSQFTRRPFLIERDDNKDLRKIVEETVTNKKIDVIHADQLSMAQFAFKPKDRAHWPVTIFDAHNAVWTIVDRTKKSAPLFLQPVLALETKRIRKYEGQIVSDFDHILAVSDIDKQALIETVTQKVPIKNLEKKITVIPIAVDTEALPISQRNQYTKNILTMGTLHYPPNADGIRWFLNEVFPIVLEKMPEVTLTIVGKNPPSDFIQMARERPQNIYVTGYVPDLTPYFESAAMLVVPVRAGGGIRVRILEAFARAMPTITTKVGLEGIEASPGLDVLVEDEANSFAEAVTDLLSNKDLQNQLAHNGRRLAESRYDWQIILEDLERVYLSIDEEFQS